MTLMVIAVKIRYTDLPPTFYVMALVSSIFITIGSMLHSRKIKDMLLLLKENKDLTNTIRKILEIFPEGVIIQEIDGETLRTLTKYANGNARDKILNMDSTGSFMDLATASLRVRTVDGERVDMNISKFLERQNKKIEEIKDNQNAINSMISLAEEDFELSSSIENEEDTKHYNIKTMKVNWDKTEDAIMHIFIDTADVKKLEEERAKYS
mmetsp:Transcript_2728/g.2283  ORF Transcript_2728/g.2283 Transcript_2728/m.2283 type:complete len:210 (+) Transcript_2728:139-768(+)